MIGRFEANALPSSFTYRQTPVYIA